MRKYLFLFFVSATLIFGAAFESSKEFSEDAKIETVVNDSKDNDSFWSQPLHVIAEDFKKEDGKTISEMIGEVIVDSITAGFKAVVTFFSSLFS
ncbi:hypothetical protein [Jiulongibacter sp. NS-SX5]|uniref:hypothetical protein n=1 Tax=Jiulongibacter sp. NS-SX5 TaxID=3463854 RepID=UPI00405A49D3